MYLHKWYMARDDFVLRLFYELQLLLSCHTMWVHTERAVFVLDLNLFQILLMQWQLAYTYRTHMLCCMWFIIVVITRNYSVTTRLTRRYVVTVSSTKFWFRILPAFGCVVAVHKPCSTHGGYVIYAYVDCTHCGVSVLASASTHTRSVIVYDSAVCKQRPGLLPIRVRN